MNYIALWVILLLIFLITYLFIWIMRNIYRDTKGFDPMMIPVIVWYLLLFGNLVFIFIIFLSKLK